MPDAAVKPRPANGLAARYIWAVHSNMCDDQKACKHSDIILSLCPRTSALTYAHTTQTLGEHGGL